MLAITRSMVARSRLMTVLLALRSSLSSAPGGFLVGLMILHPWADSSGHSDTELSSKPANTSTGVCHPSVLRGRPLSSSATLSRSAWKCNDRSVPFGKYCRSNPLVFSLVPRCHGECGSQTVSYTHLRAHETVLD